MLDHRLRSTKERLLTPLAAPCAGRVPVAVVTMTGFAFCVSAGGLAWAGQPILALISWLIGRFLDGLDGVIARADGSASDLGGYVDFLLDTIGYAVVALGVAAAADDRAMWIIVAILIATFYVNSVSWLLLSSLLEKRAAGAASRAAPTSVTMPPGLVEGTETILLFAIALAFPAIAGAVFVAMSLGVAVSVAQRAIAARRLLT